MHVGLKREISIQKAGELAKDRCSGLHLVAAIIELILPKTFFSPTLSSSQTSDSLNKDVNDTKGAERVKLIPDFNTEVLSP